MATEHRQSRTLLDLAGFEIAVFCALPIESEAVESTFDEIYQNEEIVWQKVDGDQNAYTLGRIGVHNVVLAHMPRMGKIRAASAASSLRITFPNIKLALVAGICGGATQTPDKRDIFLGDVIISTELQQGDFGREYPDGIDLKDAKEGGSRPAPPEIAAFLHRAQTKHFRDALYEGTRELIDGLLSYLEAVRPTPESDILYSPYYLHKHRQQFQGSDRCQCNSKDTAICDAAKKLSCRQLGCDIVQQARQRTAHVDAGPSIYFGAIATTDIVKKNENTRDHYAQEHQILAFEMEGAGIWEIFPTIIVKAVSDYADSHKNKTWQQYAAVSAAACCKTLLSQWLPSTRGTGKLETVSNLQATKRNPEDDEKIRKNYLASLNFEQLDSRYHQIKPAYPKTCDWVFDSHEFQAWLNSNNVEEHHRVLWIKGKPGSGKSTLMKHLHGACGRYFPDYTVAVFFFHGRGSELQKSRLGMLRSLVCQLLEGDGDLLQKFMGAFPSRGRPIQNRRWIAEELESFLLQCTRQGWLKNTVLLIDALDECDEVAAREFTSLCENLAFNSIDRPSQLFVCLSIRHFPNISVRHCIQVDIDQKAEHDSDITKYVSGAIPLKNTDLIDRIKQKAQHVFLWAVLAVQILTRLYDEGADLQTMLGHLAELPDTLHEIFKDLIQHGGGGLNKKGILIFQVVLFAQKPLTPRELYLLVMSGHDPSRFRDWDWNDMDNIRLKNWIITESRGLLEVAVLPQNSDDDEPFSIKETSTELERRAERHIDPSGLSDQSSFIVQVIHESVRDFLLILENAPWLEGKEVQSLCTLCHAKISVCCVASMVAGTGATRLSIESQYPHLIYALKYLPFHIEQAQLSKQDLVQFVKRYADALMDYSWFYRFRTHWPGTSHGDILLRAITTIPEGLSDRTRFKKSAENLLRAVLGARSSIDYHVSGSILFSIEEQGWSAVMKILIDAGVDILVKDTGGYNLIDATFANLLAMGPVTMRSVTGDARVELTCALIEAFIKAGYTTHRAGRPDVNLLIDAIKIGSSKLVSLLLHVGSAQYATHAEKDYNLSPIRDSFGIEVTDTSGQTPLNAASAKGYPEIVRLLLEKGAGIETANTSGKTPLGCASARGHSEVVHLLLEKGASIETVDSSGFTPLNHAARGGYLASVQLLVEKGANLESYDKNGFTPLSIASSNGHLEVVRLLVEKGANLESYNKNEFTPLSIASSNGHLEVVRLLVEKGADLESYNKNGFTPLSIASSNGHLGVVWLLVKEGANTETRSKDGWTPLWSAAKNGHFKIVRLLCFINIISFFRVFAEWPLADDGDADSEDADNDAFL